MVILKGSVDPLHRAKLETWKKAIIPFFISQSKGRQSDLHKRYWNDRPKLFSFLNCLLKRFDKSAPFIFLGKALCFACVLNVEYVCALRQNMSHAPFKVRYMEAVKRHSLFNIVKLQVFLSH